MPACRALLINKGCRVRMAAIPPANAYSAQTKASNNANEPKTSKQPPLSNWYAPGNHYPRYDRPVEPDGLGTSPGAASYFEAHFACTCSASKCPSEPIRPSISACELSINESGSGSFPV